MSNTSRLVLNGAIDCSVAILMGWLVMWAWSRPAFYSAVLSVSLATGASVIVFRATK